MLPQINGMWFYSNNGDLLIEFQNKETISNEDIGLLISTFKNLSQELTGGEFKSITMKEKKFIGKICLEGNAILCCMINENVKEEKINQVCEVVSKMFEERFNKADILKLNENMSKLEDFKRKVNLYFKMMEL